MTGRQDDRQRILDKYMIENITMEEIHPCMFVKLMIYRENPAKNPSLRKKSAKVWHRSLTFIQFNNTTAGGIVNLHVFCFWLKQSLILAHPPSPISPFRIHPTAKSLYRSNF
jgi:hypothetical protein